MHFYVVKLRTICICLVIIIVSILLSVSIDGVNAAQVYFGYANRKVPIYYVQTEEKQVAISFDAAWGADKTEGIMKILKEYNAGGTFFLVGFWTDKYADIVKKIDENGFEITKIDFSKSGKNVTLGDVFKMILNEDEENENGESIPMGNSFNKGNFDNFFKPNIRIKNEMILPAIPLPVRPLLPGFVQNLLISDRSTIQKLKEVASSSERFVGLFLRKEMSSNELSDSPDIIRNLDDIFSVGTYFLI